MSVVAVGNYVRVVMLYDDGALRDHYIGDVFVADAPDGYRAEQFLDNAPDAYLRPVPMPVPGPGTRGG